MCEDRVRLIRRTNPSTAVYVLYGGDPMQGILFERQLSPLVDDYHEAIPDPPTDVARKPGLLYRNHWKRQHGDLLIADWYVRRGAYLDWDTVFVVQWDTLIYDRVADLVPALQPDQVLLSGLTSIRSMRSKWDLVSRDGGIEYGRFLEHMARRYGFSGDPKCFVPIVWCLPRRFLDRYVRIERPSLGHCDYRVPICAEALDFSFCTEHDLNPTRTPRRPGDTLRAGNEEIWVPTIWQNLRRKNGARVFHPYRHLAPGTAQNWFSATLGSTLRAAARPVRKAVWS
jgi:hypothetical protein